MKLIKTKTKHFREIGLHYFVLLEIPQWVRFYKGGFMNFRPKIGETLNFDFSFFGLVQIQCKNLILEGNFNQITNSH
jgi:hypothetical protein